MNKLKSKISLVNLANSLHNSMAPADVESLCAAIEKRGIVELGVGTKVQWGDKACVIGLTGGARCVKVMAHLPPGMVLGEAGLATLYNEWVKGAFAGRTEAPPISADKAQAMIFAAVLEGEVERFPMDATVKGFMLE